MSNGSLQPEMESNEYSSSKKITRQGLEQAGTTRMVLQLS